MRKPAQKIEKHDGSVEGKQALIAKLQAEVDKAPKKYVGFLDCNPDMDSTGDSHFLDNTIAKVKGPNAKYRVEILITKVTN